MTTSLVDPLSLQVFANLFSSIADRMGVTLQQASFSPNIKMRRDFSCAIFDANGRLLAQAAHIPVHLGAMPLAMDAVRARFNLRPGDVVIMNDPYQGGTHLPDVSLVSAAFTDDGLRLGYVMSRAHHADMGGMSPGSMPLSREIYQEGVIIPPLLLAEGGRTNEAVLELLLRNVRTPDERRGDFDAQRTAQAVGEDGLTALAHVYGVDSVNAHGLALQDYAERAMRQCISDIPPGEYRFSDVMDDDGLAQHPVAITVTVTRRAGSTDLGVDFAGSAPQVSGSINAVRAVTLSATLYVMRCLQREDVPVNQGSIVPLHVRTPHASVVAAESPAAVAGGNVETSQRIVDVLFGALASALPDRVPAASQGTMNNLAMGGFDAARGRHFAYYETMGGGMGARPMEHGASGQHDHMSNTLNTPIEVLESEYPVHVESYSLRPESGGKGHFRGGKGIHRRIRFLGPATVTVLSERRAMRPYGLHGADPGAPGRNSLVRDGAEIPLPSKATIEVGEGDVLSIETPGGGGLDRLPGPEYR